MEKNLNRFTFSGTIEKIESLQDVPRLYQLTIRVNGLTLKALLKKKLEGLVINDFVFVESKLTKEAFVVEITRIYKIER